MNIYLIIAAAVLIIILTIVFILKTVKRNKKGSKDFYSQSRVVNENLGTKLRKMFGGKAISEKELEELEEVLLRADIGPKISIELIEKIREKSPKNIDDAINILKSEIDSIVRDGNFEIKKGQLNILLVLGVNGVGKTTSIAKLANYHLEKGCKVLLAAGDTFRAAAVEQITKWANRLDVPVIKQQEGSDPASVVYDAIDSARAKGVDLLIVDTAGRLHNKANLMEELKKIERVINNKENIIKKNLLVIDATTGQNGYQQAESFNKAVGVDGILIAKYDSQSKSGVVINIQKNLNIPFYFIGNGEKIENLTEFRKNEFIENIFS